MTEDVVWQELHHPSQREGLLEFGVSNPSEQLKLRYGKELKSGLDPYQIKSNGYVVKCNWTR